MSAALKPTTSKPRLLFVDDEKRVLNSMRIMFRREFDLHLANNGKEALAILEKQDIDVIIADHRMPGMSGVEVLTQARTISPRTVRILLTGYADLNAVEDSINDGEVFRFLTKPCPPDQLREAITLGIQVARESSAKPRQVGGRQAAAGATRPAQPDKTQAQAPRPVSRERLAQGLGIVVFSSDPEILRVVQHIAAGRVPVFSASNIVRVVDILTEHRPGVLLTDISDDKATIQAMTARLKEHLPELVTIAVSPHRDVLDMVWLINHGQIFRFLRKPLSPGRCAVSLQAALKHHRMLLRHPEMVQRHRVDTSRDDGGLVGGVLAKLKTVRRLWASA